MTRKLGCITLALLALLAFGSCTRQAPQNLEQVVAPFTAAPLPFEDPRSKLWNDAPEHPGALFTQEITEPMLTEPGVGLVKVRALHNGEWIVFRLEWSDSTQDLIPRAGRSSDAAAIQFPLAGDGDVPDAAMGQEGKGVRIWYWKALWQDDAQRAQAGGGDRIASLYPNAAIDHYPYEANSAARAEMEKRYAPARAAGNPVTSRPNAGLVQVLGAEGFGNVRTVPEQLARGKGEWARGVWVVTIARPLRGAAELGDLTSGKRSYAAFAIWDGAHAHTGSRKMRSDWIPLVLEKK
jgi:DMSO reductase family type II enzyme heme b subunit